MFGFETDFVSMLCDYWYNFRPQRRTKMLPGGRQKKRRFLVPFFIDCWSILEPILEPKMIPGFLFRSTFQVLGRPPGPFWAPGPIVD